MLNKNIETIKKLDKKSKEILCLVLAAFMLISCVLFDATLGEARAAGKDITDTPHTVKAGDTVLAVVGSQNEAKLVIEEIKKAYGYDSNAETAIISPVLKTEAKEMALAERDPQTLSVDEAVSQILAMNNSSTPIFKITVKTAMIRKEVVQYETKVEKTSDLKVGEKKVKTQGETGINLVTGQTTMVNGKAVDSVVYSKEVIKEPVTEVVYEGTKTESSSSGSSSSAGVSTGSMRWPFPSSRNVVSGYGGRVGPIYGNEFHMGYDIAGSYGASIVAADGGTVVEAGWHNSYGYQVVIRHSNGLKTRYAHNSTLKVKVGQKVSKGQVIALCGSTGDSTAPHLHFEVWKNGSHVNPGNYV